MDLAKQALLSTAELIKCIDLGITNLSTDEKLMDTLYGDTERAQSRYPSRFSDFGCCSYRI